MAGLHISFVAVNVTSSSVPFEVSVRCFFVFRPGSAEESRHEGSNMPRNKSQAAMIDLCAVVHDQETATYSTRSQRSAVDPRIDASISISWYIPNQIQHC